MDGHWVVGHWVLGAHRRKDVHMLPAETIKATCENQSNYTEYLKSKEQISNRHNETEKKK